MEKGWGLHFSAVLSSSQSTIISKFPEFLRVKELKTNPTNTTKSIKNCGKTMKSGQKQWENTQNKWKKVGNWISQQHTAAHSAALSSTQQCSAVLNLQLNSRFPDFLQGQGWKRWERSQKKAPNPSKIWEKQWTLDKTMGDTHTRQEWIIIWSGRNWILKHAKRQETNLLDCLFIGVLGLAPCHVHINHRSHWHINQQQ